MLTMLSSMAGPDFEQAFDRHVEWGLKVLDLKDGLFGKMVDQLTDAEAEAVAAAARKRGLPVYTVSTCLFGDDIEKGEAHFRERHLGGIRRAAAVAGILKAKQVRLLAAGSSKRAEFRNCADYLARRHPWLIPMYAQAIDRLGDFQVTIENEIGDTLFTCPKDVLDFFSALGRQHKCHFTWDVQNMWQVGTFPTMAVYEELKPLIGMLHVKGGRAEKPGGPLRWGASLADASWPVAEIVRAAVADGVSPVVCLNPSHGERGEGYAWTADDYRRDIEFLKRVVS